MFGSILDLLGNLLPAVGFPPVGGLIQRVHIDRFSLLHAKNGARNFSYREMTVDSRGLVPVR